jgi:hypothetical protein
LFSTLDAVMPQADWQREMLRALQTWAAETGLELTVVSDSGDPLGTPGAAQGDPRFGDIRIAGTPLSSGLVSASAPFDPEAGTYAGDILFNTAAPLGTDYDIYTVALHEMGHVLGLPSEYADPNSVMFSNYTGPKDGLSSADVVALHSLAGTRPPDAFEGRTVNFQQAAWQTFNAELKNIDEDARLDGDLPYAVDGNLSRGDVDSFTYQAPGAFTVALKASGRSLLHGKVSVLDAEGQIVASASADDVGGDVELSVSALARQKFTIRVEGAEDSVFGVGEYRLVVKPAGVDTSPYAVKAQEMMARLHRNDTLRTATVLSPLPGPERDYAHEGTIGRPGDVDFYRIDHIGGSRLDAQVWTAGPAVTLTLLDSHGHVVATSHGGQNGATLHAEGLSPGGRYYLKVSGPPGAYTLGAQVDAPLDAPTLVDHGVLTADSSQQFRGLLLPESGVVRLDVNLKSASRGATVEVALFDLDGDLVYRTLVKSGKEAKLKTFLPEGAYTMRLLGANADGSPLSVLPYTINTSVLTDAIGPKLIGPNPPPQPIVPEWFGSGFKVVLAVTDPFGRPVTFIEPPPVVFLPPNKVPTPWPTPKPVGIVNHHELGEG